MRNWKMTLAAGLMTLSLTFPTLAAENQPSDNPTPQVTTEQSAPRNELVAEPAIRQPRPTPETVDNRNDFPDYRAKPIVRSQSAPVLELKLDSDAMQVQEQQR